MALQQLPHARPKLVEEIYSHVAAQVRTETLEHARAGARPIGTIRAGNNARSQQSQEIRRVQCPLSRVFASDKNA